jgi:hypothetical protein
MLATVQKYQDSPTPPPIRATIVAGNNDVSIRISDQGVYQNALSVMLPITLLQEEVFLFLKSNLHPTYSHSRTSEMQHGWNVLALVRCAP